MIISEARKVEVTWWFGI